VYRQSIYTNRAGINSVTQVPDGEIAQLRKQVEATGLFRQAGRELKCLIDRAMTDQEIAALIAKHGLKV